MVSSVYFTHLLLVVVLTLIVNIKYVHDRANIYEIYFEDDLHDCFSCYEHQVQPCREFYTRITYDDDKQMLNLLNYVLPKNTKRKQHWLQFKEKPHHKIVAKKFAEDAEHQAIRMDHKLSLIKEEFFKSDRLEGMQICPAANVDKFVQQFVLPKNELTAWFYMLINIQLILLPYIERLGFPVPETYAVCGLTLFQANAGQSLRQYYGAEFKTKLTIAIQLLEGVLKFSHGFNGYRIYLTDITEDNIVFDEESEKLTFVDLDTILIVDSSDSALLNSTTHQHEYIDCPNCFAYSPDALCGHTLSDMNLFEACQFLRKDLKGNFERGFLHPIPNSITKNYTELAELMDKCIDCKTPTCLDRFSIAEELILLLNKFLVEY